MKRPAVEDSLENTFSCVPKVQGSKPNLSGKRTETQDALLRSSPCAGCFLFLYEKLKEVIDYVRQTH